METNRVEIKKTETKRMEPDMKLINMETVENRLNGCFTRLSLMGR